MGYKTLLLEVFLRCLCRHTPSACHHRILFNPQLLSNLRTKACLSWLCHQTWYFIFWSSLPLAAPLLPCGLGVVALLSHRGVFCGWERCPQCPHSQHSLEAGLHQLRLRDEAWAGSARLRTRMGATVTGHCLLRAWLASSPGRSWVCPPALTPVLGMGAPEQMGSLQARLGPERRRDQNTTEAGRAASTCGSFPGPTQDPHGPLQNQL